MHGGGQGLAVGASAGVDRGQQVDAGEALERLGHRQPLGLGHGIDRPAAEAKLVEPAGLGGGEAAGFGAVAPSAAS